MKTYLETLRWEVTIFTRHCSVRLSLVPIDGTWPGWVGLSFLLKYKKQGWFVVSLKRREIIMLSERWVKVLASDGQYFQWHVFINFWKYSITFHKKSARTYSKSKYIITHWEICFVLSDLFSVAKQARFPKLGSKPGWLKRQYKNLPLSHEETSPSEGNLNGYVSQLFLFTYIRLTTTERSIHMKSLALW